MDLCRIKIEALRKTVSLGFVYLEVYTRSLLQTNRKALDWWMHGIEGVSTIFLIPAISFQISESAHFGRKERIVTKLEMPTCSSPPRGGRLSAQVGRALQPQDWPVTRGESHQSWSSTGGTPHLINHFSLGLGYASQTRKQGKTKG